MRNPFIKSLGRLRIQRIKLAQGKGTARLTIVMPARTLAISRSLEETPIASNAPQSVVSDVINNITMHPTNKDKCQTSTVIDKDFCGNLFTTSTVKIH